MAPLILGGLFFRECLTPTPTPITITEQDQVITVVVTFTPPPTPTQHNEAPLIIDLAPGAVVVEEREILLHWGWNGFLRKEEYFDIKLKSDGQNRSAYVRWERGQAHNLVANLAPGRYWWSVQVVQGYYQNNSNQPEDRVFEAFTSPESEPHLIIVVKKEEAKTPTPRPTTDHPDLSRTDEPDTPMPEPTADNN